MKQLDYHKLLGTNWLSQFKWGQIQQIIRGLDAGLDVGVYAKPEFTHLQMEQIRYGLIDGLDVSCYAKPELNWSKMLEIRESMG